MVELKPCPRYRIKNGVNLFTDLQQFGFYYYGNYFRGDNWHRKMDGIDDNEPKNGITVHGDWDNRKICFKHPYRNHLEAKSVEPFIRDLIAAGIAEQED